MLVHPQAFLDVALGQSGLRLTRLAGAAPRMQRAREGLEGERLLGPLVTYDSVRGFATVR